MRLTCLNTDKNLSTETNFQKCHRPVSEHDFLRTTNKFVFLVINLPVNSVNFNLFFRITLHLLLQPSSHSWVIMNPGFRNNFPNSRFLGHPFWSNNEPKWSARLLQGSAVLLEAVNSTEHLSTSDSSFGALSESLTETSKSRLLYLETERTGTDSMWPFYSTLWAGNNNLCGEIKKK